MDGLVSNLKRFVGIFGEDGKGEINTVCSKHQVELAPQDTTKFSYGGLDVKDGVLRLVFAENQLGTNVSDVSVEVAKALKNAPAAPGTSAFNIDARNSVREEYDPHVEEVRSSIAGLVNLPDLNLNPNFEHNATMLAKNPGENPNWDKQLGSGTLAYFKGLEGQIKRAGFKGDEMLQEGFQEAVEKGEICFRVLDKLTKSTYNEVVIEKGVLYIQVSSLPPPPPPSLLPALSSLYSTLVDQRTLILDYAEMLVY